MKLSNFNRGVTIREYFSIKVMQGMLSSGKWTHTPKDNCARDAVYYADALIEELNKPVAL